MVTASDILSVHGVLKTQRQTFNEHWLEVAEVLVPSKVRFFADERNSTKGDSFKYRQYDATPAMSLDIFSAVVMSLVTPRNQVWHDLESITEEGEDVDNSNVDKYLEGVRNSLFRYRWSSNFNQAVHECYHDLGAFGTMCLYIGRGAKGLFYRSIPIHQIYILSNQYDNIDYIHREYTITAKQILEEFNRPSDVLPQQVRDIAERNPAHEFRFLHCVKPNMNQDKAIGDYRSMPFVSYTISIDHASIVRVSGFETFPYAVGRYNVLNDEEYGRSPAMSVLPDINMLNQMNKVTMKAAQYATQPALLVHSDGILNSYSLTPGALNFGGVDDQGRKLVHPLDMGSNINISLEMMDQKRTIIKAAFWNTLFQILVEMPQITATEAMIRAQEKGALLAPTAARIESEFLTPLIEREINLLEQMGKLKPPPEELLAVEGENYTVKYTSTIATAAQAEEGVSILRTLEQLAPIAQVAGVEIFDRFDWVKVVKKLADVNNVPPSILRDDDEMEAMAQQKAQEAQMQQILQAAPIAASAAKDLAGAQAAAGAGGILPDIGV